MLQRCTNWYVVSDAYHKRHQAPLFVLLDGLLQGVPSQRELLIGWKKPHLDQSDQTCLLN